tara:strand:+ start:8955 stop:9710 length:756 start_codon:yes stop_codon:yes gene_type:complete
VGRENINDTNAENVVFKNRLRLEPLTRTLTAALTLVAEHPPLMYLDPGGASRAITLPAEGNADVRGLVFLIHNTADADEDLTVSDDGGTVIAIIEQGKSALLTCDGTTWLAENATGGKGIVAIADAATYTVLPANSGKVHYIPNLTADCTITLPAEDEGLEYEFIYSGVAADAQDWIFDTGSDTNYFIGGMIHLDTDGDLNVLIAPDGNSNSKLTVLVPQPGTSVKMYCDGTLWILDGRVTSTTIPTFADQ